MNSLVMQKFNSKKIFISLLFSLLISFCYSQQQSGITNQFELPGDPGMINNQVQELKFYTFQASKKVNIHFTSLDTANVSLAIFDSSGSTVVLDSFNVEKGIHSIVYNLASSAGGVYFVRIENELFVVTAKSQLVKEG